MAANTINSCFSQPNQPMLKAAPTGRLFAWQQHGVAPKQKFNHIERQ
jgi:hypothetical protein